MRKLRYNKCLLWLVLLILPTISFAATPKDYRERLESARFSTEELLENVQAGDVTNEKDLLAEIGQNVPVTERIEWPGGSIETNNSWLSESLKKFSEGAAKTQRSLILIAVSERLLAVSERAKELEKLAAADQTKDADKQKLAEILLREEYKKAEPKEESLFQKWWREFREWLRRVFPSGPELAPSTNGLGSLQFGLQILIFVVVVGLIGFLIYKFVPFLKRRSGKKKKSKKGDRVILGERLGDDESAADLFSEAEQMARDGNLRGAIRKGYIALLCDLSDRKIVKLARHKTNRDYLRDVRKQQSIFESLRGLTLSFETSWYGLRTAEMSDWEDFRTRYMQAVAEAKRFVR